MSAALKTKTRFGVLCASCRYDTPAIYTRAEAKRELIEHVDQTFRFGASHAVILTSAEQEE